ncbi:MAG: helix-turn-helix domain-containing protein [Ruminococcus sp.]|nr:helix-turn-helix domain-containing protein [Ruminococcus sp.]
MENNLNNKDIDILLNEFFSKDDLKSLAADAGAFLGCPILVLNATFHVVAHYRPFGFSDLIFQDSIRHGEITYEAGAIISQSEALLVGKADYVKLEESVYQRRFAPLISSGVRLGYLICVDTDGHLHEIPREVWNKVEQILAKQMFIETSRQDKTFETAEDILKHLLDGGFSSQPYFQLQVSNTYLADFHPFGFALINLTAYHKKYMGKRHLKDELETKFPQSHPFLYKGDVIMFSHGAEDFSELSMLAEEFKLKAILSDKLQNLFELPELYRTAHEALELMLDHRFHRGNVFTVDQLRTLLVLKKLEGRHDLIVKEIQILHTYDKEKDTEYCETLYQYLNCCRSLKKTCDVLFTHRNTVLYRIRRMQDDFGIPLDDPSAHAKLLFGVSQILFEEKGPDFFLDI